jgi:hypothetical protein
VNKGFSGDGIYGAGDLEIMVEKIYSNGKLFYVSNNDHLPHEITDEEDGYYITKIYIEKDT